jgi:hypothetical protein
VRMRGSSDDGRPDGRGTRRFPFEDRRRYTGGPPGQPAEDVTMALIQDEVKQRLGKLTARMDDMRDYL